MATAHQKKILELGKVEFEDGVKDTDRIVISEWDTGVGFGPKGYFYLYDKDGHLLDIQVGELVDKSLTQKRPKMKNSAIQGPAKTKGRPKKVKPEVVPEKKTRSAAVQQTSDKRKYKMSDETRAKRAEAMRARMKAYWAKKKAAK